MGDLKAGIRPSCGARDIFRSYATPTFRHGPYGGLTVWQYVCATCGFSEQWLELSAKEREKVRAKWPRVEPGWRPTHQIDALHHMHLQMIRDG
jgi:hypothetical protein